MPGEAVRIGPFKGGLNTLSDPTSVADSELVDCVNFELDLDGSLTSRPPISDINIGIANLKLLGYFTIDSGASYLIGSTPTNTYWFDGTTWTLIADSPGATAMAQFALSGITRLWLVAQIGSGKQSGYWTFGGAFTPLIDMPEGGSIVLYKNRLFIAPGNLATSLGSRIRFSSVTDPTSWPVNNFIDVNPGDGQNITNMALYFNNLLIFKNDSTHTYAYEASPETGIINRLSATIGASDKNCVAAHESYMYVYHEGNVYELVNSTFTRINTKVPFTIDGNPAARTIDIAISVFNDRLIVRHFDRLYVFNLKTRAWARWVSAHEPAMFFLRPGQATVFNVPTAVAVNNTNGRTLLLEDRFASNTETIDCSFITKNYDFGISSNFKRLYWWGADVIAQGNVGVSANPVVYNIAITWDQLMAFTWDALQTWDQPLTALPIVTDSVSALGAGSRKFLKFLKALRFRQIFFKVMITNDGTAATAPSRIFNLSVYVNRKQTVSKKIS